MPFGVTGGPSSFQWLMDKVLHGLSFVTSYIDNVLIHSNSMELHQFHLCLVFNRLAKAGLTLRGSKCKIGFDKVQYLGHIFSKDCMADKIAVVQNRRHRDIAAPLHHLTQKAVEFNWEENCQQSFQVLKDALTQAPILCYPCFKRGFTLQTETSAVGIGAVLEQEGHVIAYASRSLTPPESQYSVIERECLAVVLHYLLGRPFSLHTDHQPLQWLSAQKMEGRRGSSNANADDLSRVPEIQVETSSATLITPELTTHRIREEQWRDAVLQQVIQHLTSRNSTSNPNRKQFPLKRYSQLLKQLHLVDGVLRHRFVPGPLEEIITVPVMPTSLQEVALHSCHDIVSAGHQGTEKTLDRLKRMTYWVGMAKAMELYCRSCNVCQQSKLPMPLAVPMTNVPIGDGMVERRNRTLLQLLRAYVQQQSDWECQLPLLLYAYRTARHTSTHLSPFLLLMGRDPVLTIMPSLAGDDGKGHVPHSYEHTLTVRLTELRDLVVCHITQEAQRQKAFYDSTTKSRTFNVGDAVWLLYMCQQLNKSSKLK
ncbi:hypothetical protein EMCRGX_G006248 [Ephydatia muelleri]